MNDLTRLGRRALTILLVLVVAVLVIPMGTVAWQLRRLLAKNTRQPSRRVPSVFGQSCPDA